MLHTSDASFLRVSSVEHSVREHVVSFPSIAHTQRKFIEDVRMILPLNPASVRWVNCIQGRTLTLEPPPMLDFIPQTSIELRPQLSFLS